MKYMKYISLYSKIMKNKVIKKVWVVIWWLDINVTDSTLEYVEWYTIYLIFTKLLLDTIAEQNRKYQSINISFYSREGIRPGYRIENGLR